MTSSSLFRKIILFCLLFRAAWAASASPAIAYRGMLSSGGVAATGRYDLTFTLYDSLLDGKAVSATLTNSDITVIDGQFAVPLEFAGSSFDGRALWLGIGVRSKGSNESYTPLSPRQPMTVAPYVQDAGGQSSPAMEAGTEASAEQTPVPVKQVFQAPLGISATAGAPLIFASSGTNPAAGFTLQNGNWGDSFGMPVAYFQPTTPGVFMPLDLMPLGPYAADAWIDICDRDVNLYNHSFWEALDLKKFANDYAQIGTSTIGGQVRDLVLQHNGGRLGVGTFNSVIRPLMAMQVRPRAGINLGIDSTSQGLLMAAYPDAGSSRIPIRAEASRFMFSGDTFGNAYTFGQFRTASNVNVGIDRLGASGRITAFNDDASVQIPMFYQASAHHFINSGGYSELLTIADKNVGIGQTAPNGLLILDVGGTNRAARPFPPVTSQQRTAMTGLPDGSGVYNTDLGAIEYVRSGKWYRQGQRPSVAVGTLSKITVTDDMDIVLVKGTGLRSVVLPAALNCPNRVLEVKDAAFRASTDIITISSAGGLVENQATLTISSNGGSVRLVSDGTDWFKLN